MLIGSWLAVCALLRLSPVRPCWGPRAEIRPLSSPEPQSSVPVVLGCLCAVRSSECLACAQHSSSELNSRPTSKQGSGSACRQRATVSEADSESDTGLGSQQVVTCRIYCGILVRPSAPEISVPRCLKVRPLW